MEADGKVQRVAHGMYIGKKSTPAALRQTVQAPVVISKEDALASYNRALLNLGKIQARLRGLEEERAQLLQAQPVAEAEVEEARDVYEAATLQNGTGEQR